AAFAADADAADPDPAPLDLADRAVAALEALAAALGPAAADAAAARDGLVRGMASGEAAVGTARAEVRRLDAVAAEAREAVHRAEVEVAVAAERAAEAGPPPAADDEEVDPEAVAAELEALRRRRASIGAVNPLAAQEQQELAEREADMQAQIADLEATAERLRAHMTELDQAVAAGFDSLFRSLCDRFEEVCGLLFPGGRGRLSAVLDEDGEPGIEVEVVPAGKRPRPLSLLSGGERSLVALAFCLALAMARPAPFYLLDEVEAALDDVNLRRFLSVVRRLADGGRQFLLITHQQPTVEIADTLFGVTMAGEGVSQVLARRLDRPADDRQEAPPARLRAIPGGRGA
ncbi:MAG: AAA family ATPase, partial [Miltoncostaeaceae bacterium]